MNRALPQEVLDQIELEHQHFAAAPQAFFEAWKRGVDIAGAEWFGDGTREGLQRATTKWDLRPKLLMLNDALGVLSSGQRMFLSAMVSFYNAREGGAMLKRCGFEAALRPADVLLFFPPHEGHASLHGAMSLLFLKGVIHVP
ncbi:hypothetical protein [Pseudomonas aeruginosa]|uniref:hypothetical protein n=1 Tax=Pseudomonas aeruginosa TaxID=287 RepID=UPI003D0681D4